MRAKLIALALAAFTVKANLFAQVIISQNFEAPLTGWTNQGNLVSSQGTVNPHAGGGMLAINTGSMLISPTFSLPGGAKNLTFWVNEYNASPFGGYGISASLLQNSTSVLSLGTWSDVNAWTQQGVNIPSGFSGSNFSISFAVQPFIDPNVIFYLDDIALSVGTTAVGIKENTLLNSDIKICKDSYNEKRIKIYSNESVENSELQIYTLDGKLIFTQKDLDIMRTTPLEIDLTGGKEGLYIVKLISSKGVIARKFIL
ncbi:MAG: T9SS type A sorting domain-containing protein [Bacteroidia bacterium]|nr:T9SS type A sorting domain-containing protein [Bacteroidia bacterium]